MTWTQHSKLIHPSLQLLLGVGGSASLVQDSPTSHTTQLLPPGFIKAQ